jgi:hypothetical protein
MTTLFDGQHLTLPNGVAVVCEPGHHPGLTWLLRHSWCTWGILADGRIVNVVTRKGKVQATPTGWTLADLTEAAPLRMPA